MSSSVLPALTGLTLSSVIDLSSGWSYTTIGATAESYVGIDKVVIHFDRDISSDHVFGSLQPSFTRYDFLGLYGIGDDDWTDGSSSNLIVFNNINFNGPVDIKRIDVTDTLGQKTTYTIDDLRAVGFQTSINITGGYDYSSETYVTLPDVITIREGQSVTVDLQAHGLRNHFANLSYYTTTLGGTVSTSDLQSASGNGSFWVSSTFPQTERQPITITAERDDAQESVETAYLVVDVTGYEQVGHKKFGFEDGGSLKVIEVRILDDNLTTGGTSSDTLRGTSAAEVLTGGAGNDTYYLTLGDTVVELANGGIDTVNAGFTHTLAVNVENLTLTGNAAINGTGNLLANRLTGNAAANQLVGGIGADSLFGNGGNDTLWGGIDNDLLDGGIGNDWLDGGAGTDTLRGGAGNDVYVPDNAADVIAEAMSQGTDTVRATFSTTLGYQLENLTLLGTGNLNGTGNGLNNILTGTVGANRLEGGAGNDTLTGGDGADWLDGGTGIDLLRGGTGNDIYIVDNSGDQVAEAAGQGIDLVRANASFKLWGEVENLILTGNAAISGTGNALNNSLTGNAAANLLTGGAGNDILNGGGWQDTINGGAGTDQLAGGLDAARDVFIFNALSDSAVGAGRDRITDLRTGVDDIDLRALDADTRIAGNQAFDFLGTAAAANSVWYLKAGANLLIRADVTGDKVADLEIAVLGQNALGAGDFLL